MRPSTKENGEYSSDYCRFGGANKRRARQSATRFMSMCAYEYSIQNDQ